MAIRYGVPSMCKTSCGKILPGSGRGDSGIRMKGLLLWVYDERVTSRGFMRCMS